MPVLPKNRIRPPFITLVGNQCHAPACDADRTGEYTLHQAHGDSFLNGGTSSEERACYGAPEERDEQHDTLTMLRRHRRLSDIRASAGYSQNDSQCATIDAYPEE